MRHGAIEGSAGFGHLPLVGQDHRLLGPRRADQVDHTRHALPTHVHAKPDFGHPQVRVARHDPEIQSHRQRDDRHPSGALRCEWLHAPLSSPGKFNPQPTERRLSCSNRVTFLTGADRDFPNWRRHGGFLLGVVARMISPSAAIRPGLTSTMS
jgi:hypothetical protein